jgi:Bacteriophage Sf6, terminase small subunit-like
MANRTKNTPEKRALFLGALTEGVSVTAACDRAVITRRTVYDWRDADPEFAKAWDEAIEAGTDRLEDEAVRRAYEGIDDPVFYQGVKCGVVRKYSDTLLIFMLKARRPEKFKDRVATDHTVHKSFEDWLDELHEPAKQMIEDALADELAKCKSNGSA